VTSRPSSNRGSFFGTECLVSAQDEDAKVSVDMIGILAGYKRASFGGNRLDFRFLDWTQLRCCGEWLTTGQNSYVGDSSRSRKNMRSANIANISQHRMDHVSWVYEVTMPRDPKCEKRPADLIGAGIKGGKFACGPISLCSKSETNPLRPPRQQTGQIVLPSGGRCLSANAA
jgi:hypothetical protein